MSNPDLTTFDRTADGEAYAPEGPASLTVTILWHRDPTRIGAHAQLPMDGGPVHLSRTGPVFSDGAPLDDPQISRKLLQLVPQADASLRLWPAEPRLRYDLPGKTRTGGEHLEAEQLAQGALLGLGRGALLLLRHGDAPQREPGFGLVGASPALCDIGQRIHTVAPLGLPTLVTGPTGTGKELVARAIHQASQRHQGPFVSVNLAALAPGTAPSQLFGHCRGAFTGASAAHPGYFGEADGGTLLLDELGACPAEVQAQLLRALESGEIQPVGGSVRTVDVRVVAATDTVTAERPGESGVSAPLFFRMARTRIATPRCGSAPPISRSRLCTS